MEAEAGAIWMHAENCLKAHRKLSLRESGVAQTLVVICCERGYSMRFDADELAGAVNAHLEGSGDTVSVAEVEALRSKLLKHKFFAENGGVWTLHPHLYLTEDPYAKDAA